MGFVIYMVVCYLHSAQLMIQKIKSSFNLPIYEIVLIHLNEKNG